MSGGPRRGIFGSPVLEGGLARFFEAVEDVEDARLDALCMRLRVIVPFTSPPLTREQKWIAVGRALAVKEPEWTGKGKRGRPRVKKSVHVRRAEACFALCEADPQKFELSIDALIAEARAEDPQLFGRGMVTDRSIRESVDRGFKELMRKDREEAERLRAETRRMEAEFRRIMGALPVDRGP